MKQEHKNSASRPGPPLVPPGAWVAVVAVALLTSCGCAGPSGGRAKPNGSPGEVGAGGGGGGAPITAAELDELTRAFADRYVGLLASTCDAIKKDNPDPVQRREAQVLLVDCATNVYDIASNADAFTRPPRHGGAAEQREAAPG